MSSTRVGPHDGLHRSGSIGSGSINFGFDSGPAPPQVQPIFGRGQGPTPISASLEPELYQMAGDDALGEQYNRMMAQVKAQNDAVQKMADSQRAIEQAQARTLVRVAEEIQ